MNQGDRLKQIAEVMYKNNKTAFARDMGVSYQTLHPYFTDQRRIGAKMRDRLRDLGINPDWVDMGAGNMLLVDNVVEYNTKVYDNEDTVNTNEARIVKMMPLKDQSIYFKYFPYPAGAGYQPADNQEAIERDIINILTYNKDKSFIAEVTGDSMVKAGLDPGDSVVVNTSFIPEDGDVVVASLNGDLYIKRLKVINNKRYLVSEGNYVLPIEINGEDNIEIFGVVESVSKKFRRRDKLI